LIGPVPNTNNIAVIIKVVKFESNIATKPFPNPDSIEFLILFPNLNSSFILSKMITLASTAIPSDKINPAIPGKIIEIGERLEADHIVSMDRITKMEGFEKMTLKQKLDVLNYEENFIGLRKTANTSKGSKSYSEWTRYVKENIPISADFKSAMIAKKRELEVVLQNLIDSFN